MKEINVCPGTLAAGYHSYSSTCLRNVFNGKQVSHILPYHSPRLSEEDTEKFIENRMRISISGVQEKVSLILEKNKLRLTEAGEQGTYILKPIPRDLKKVNQVPANEHLTMQIAQQVYGMETAPNALIFFEDDEPAYITKRFDVKEDGGKWRKEDFATLARRTSQNAGANFKYEYSYEEIAELIRQYVPAWRIEMERYFALVVFNFLFSNGDAHLKNFSLLETPAGDYRLSPAYDLINTRIHVDDTDLALDRGLFKEGMNSSLLTYNGKVYKNAFMEFAKRIGITESRVIKILSPFLIRHPEVEALIQRSFLDEPTKRGYLLLYNEKRNLLSL